MRKLVLITTAIFIFLGFGVIQSDSVQAEASPVYRFWSQSRKGHFFTMNKWEKSHLEKNDPSWELENIGFFAEELNNCSGLDVAYRFWSPKFEKHFYTTSQWEKRELEQNDPNWDYEFEAFCVSNAQRSGYIPVYRFWSPKFKSHFFTTSTSEKTQLKNKDPNWDYEMIAFYVDDGDHYYTPNKVGSNCPAVTQNCIPCTASSDHRCRLEPGNSSGFLGWSCQNNNPGNILASSYRANIITNNGGQAPCGTRSSSTHSYMVFSSYTAGLDALKAYVRGIAAGEHYAYGACGDCSLYYFFSKYSGSSGETYAENIASWIGVSPSSTSLNWIVENKLHEFALAIQRQEGWFEQ